jgi:NAD(P)-dependent dehydrogenase (short-subunit alcohol dehydrogenase family)
MHMGELDGMTGVVVGASRGLGRGIAERFSAAGATVVAVGRSPRALEELASAHPRIRAEVADATDPTAAGELLDRHQPDILALVAGASSLLRPVHHHTWETFSLNWQVDVRMAFHWVREALLLPLRPGSQIIVMSSGAAIHGSPMSGGYAGAKATLRFLAAYASEESDRAGLGITVTAVLPRLTPETELGRAAVAAYAARAGASPDQFAARLGPPVTPQIAGDAFVTIATAGGDGGAYELTGDGLTKLTGASM